MTPQVSFFPFDRRINLYFPIFPSGSVTLRLPHSSPRRTGPYLGSDPPEEPPEGSVPLHRCAETGSVLIFADAPARVCG